MSETVLSSDAVLTRVWVRPKATSEDRALEIEAAERAFVAARRYAYLRFGTEYLLWFVVGLSLMFWSFHTTDLRYARLYLQAGILIGDAGMLVVLVRLQRYAEHHGLS